MNKRKKVCPHCGRKLWLRDFYLLKSGNYSSWCKDCERQNKREWYQKNRKVPDGVKMDPSTGLLLQHEGFVRRIFWNRRMIDDLRRYYPTTKNEELAGIFGVSVRTIIRKARELGLQKNQEWLSGVWESHRMLARIISRSKGYPGGFQERPECSKPYRFKKGHTLTEEQKLKLSLSLKKWYRHNPSAAKKKSQKLFKPVRCKETGEEWKCIGDAARAAGVSRGYLSHYLNKGLTFHGKNYEFITTKDNEYGKDATL